MNHMKTGSGDYIYNRYEIFAGRNIYSLPTSSCKAGKRVGARSHRRLELMGNIFDTSHTYRIADVPDVLIMVRGFYRRILCLFLLSLLNFLSSRLWMKQTNYEIVP
jgi:hypothetical protein